MGVVQGILRQAQGIKEVLAILEMVKVQAVGLTQSELFGEIALKKLKGFDTAFSGDTLMSAIEEEYN